MSKTADPATAGTGLDWMAGTVVKIVAMHDQLADKGQDETISGTWTHTKPLIVSGSTSYVQVPTLTQTERLALTPANGMIVYDSTNGDLYKYTAGSRRAI